MSIKSSIRNVIARNVMPRILQNLTDPNVLLKKREEREEIRQKEGQNPYQELPLGRNLMCEQTKSYPRTH
mgnify:CR=1 FL=1